jgi:hypothetical protein
MSNGAVGLNSASLQFINNVMIIYSNDSNIKDYSVCSMEDGVRHLCGHGLTRPMSTLGQQE